MVFVLPLGAATTRRHRLGVVAAMLLPSLYELFDWFVLHPERFSQGRMGTTPEDLLVITALGFLFYVALGSPFALLGRQLARQSGPLQYVVRQLGAHEAG